MSIVRRRYENFGNCYTVLDVDLKDVDFKSAQDVVTNMRAPLIEEMQNSLGNATYKIQFTTKCRFVRTIQNGEVEETEKKEQFISNPAEPVESYVDYLQESALQIDRKIEQYQNFGSNFRIDKIILLSLRCTKYQPICRLSGHSYVQLPDKIKKSKGLVNPDNRADNLCFIYSILIVLYGSLFPKNPSRHRQYIRYFPRLRFSNLEMPMKICDIPKFERQNPHLAVNVFAYKPKDDQTQVDATTLQHPFLEVLYRSCNRQKNDIKIVNLLLLENFGKFHYVAITKLNQLINGHYVSRCQMV